MFEKTSPIPINSQPIPSGSGEARAVSQSLPIGPTEDASVPKTALVKHRAYFSFFSLKSSPGLLLGVAVFLIINTANLLVTFITQKKVVTREEKTQKQLVVQQLSQAGFNSGNLTEVNRLNNFFIDRDRLVGLANYLNSRSYRFKEFRFNFGTEAIPVSGLKAIPLTINLSGSPEEVTAFIGEFLAIPDPISLNDLDERFDPKLKVTNLTIKATIYAQENLKI